jgi:hypothetical protein
MVGSVVAPMVGVVAMSTFIRIVTFPLFLFVVAVIWFIFIGCCAVAFWDWVRK